MAGNSSGRSSDAPEGAPCAACEAWREFGAQGDGRPLPTSVAYVEEEVVVMRETHGGALVVPRQHLGNLAQFSPQDQGYLLAALRRAMLWVQDASSVASTSVEAMTASPASGGHICFRVIPTKTRRGSDLGLRLQ
jgi:hypothetical protein